jgi:hypothetical protein
MTRYVIVSAFFLVVNVKLQSRGAPWFIALSLRESKTSGVMASVRESLPPSVLEVDEYE